MNSSPRATAVGSGSLAFSKLLALTTGCWPAARRVTRGDPAYVTERSDYDVYVIVADEANESELTFDPPWTPDKMSDDAKFILRFG